MSHGFCGSVLLHFSRVDDERRGKRRNSRGGFGKTRRIERAGARRFQRSNLPDYFETGTDIPKGACFDILANTVGN